jgi:hypothetical protein
VDANSVNSYSLLIQRVNGPTKKLLDNLMEAAVEVAISSNMYRPGRAMGDWPPL